MCSRKRDGHLFAQPSLGLCLFEEGWSANLFGWFIPLPLRPREVHRDEMMESWGVTLHERTIHLNWGHQTKIIYMPWIWEHFKHEVRRPDGTWAPFVGSWEEKEPDGRWQSTFDYTYVLKSGEVQKRHATVYVERREWRWRWLRWSPWPCIKRQSIDIEFDAEVGERTGSWKGGTVGCGYDMKPGETALETLRRMEQERVFN
jgi:hypothetical protein